MQNQRAMWTAMAAISLLGTGCAQDMEEEFAEGVVAASLETTRNETAGRPAVDSVRSACLLDAEAAAQEAADRPVVGLFPATCVEKQAEGSALHVDYSDCTGPLGRVKLNGGVDAFFESKDDCSLHVEILDRGNLTTNGRPLDYDASADVRVTASERHIDWTGHFTGTTRRGKPIQQRSKLAIVLQHASSCVSLDGRIDGEVGRNLKYDADISGLSACPGACPSAGTVRATLDGKLRDRTVKVVFDGSSTAKVTGWTGREFEVEMVCDD